MAPAALPIRRRPPSYWPYDELMELGQVLIRRLTERAGVAISEIDHLQAYDGFAPLVLFWMELAGLCPPGEAWRLVGTEFFSRDRILLALPILAIWPVLARALR